MQCSSQPSGQNGLGNVDIGVILDLDSYVGRMSKTSLEMAVKDFYGTHQNYTTRLVLHSRDSGSGVVEAASAAIELLKNKKVKAILGPQKSSQADFISEIGNKTQVPIISFTATLPLVSHIETPYFIRVARSDTYQLQAITSIVKSFHWHQVVPIYDATNYGSGVITYLSDALQKVGVTVPHGCGISPSATDDQILKELYKLMTMQTRVFVVHMLPSLASRVFLKANEAGMMSKGYAWIVTDGITSLLETMDNPVIDSMQGVIGLKPYIENSTELVQFTERWKQKFSQQNPNIDRIQLSAFGLWAYDTIYALARAVESVNNIADSRFTQSVAENNLTDLASIGIFQSGPKLLWSMLNTEFKGLSGEFRLINGQLPVSSFQIVNSVGNTSKEIGFWTENGGITKQLNPDTRTSDNSGLRTVIWSGGSVEIPKGWEIPTNGRKLKVGLPVKSGFYQFINVERDNFTNAPIVTGYCRDIFEAVMKALPFGVPFEYVPFETSEGSGESKGNYDDLVHEVSREAYDIVVGDITILLNRSLYAEFTLPYTESGVSMIVRVKGDAKKNAWIFTKPLKMELWITIGAFFVYTGIIIWVLEHRVNTEFRGTPGKQIGMILWFSFSTLVFAHRERVMSNLTRFVLIVWVFVVLVLSSSYTASLTSLLTVQQLQPTFTDIDNLIRNGGSIGYQEGSFLYGVLKESIDESKLQVLRTAEDYNEALSNGSVSAIVDELPYLRFVLSQYCSKFRMVGPTNRTAGFGFAFPKGSPLVPEISRAILKVTESKEMNDITAFWFKSKSECSEQDETTVVSNSLSLNSFKGLFLIAWVSSTTALAIFLVNFLYENREILTSRAPIPQKLTAIAKTFNEKKEDAEEAKKKEKEQQETEMSDINDVPQGFMYDPTSLSPGAISLAQHEEGMFSPDEGLSSTEPGTPYHEIAVTRASEEDRQ
ncbi:hypothetical protein CDL15_Pgr007940 [Punica granatum]|uniref:Glutamate receptor n=1 Tax=Punica granatum TaxID=22663 RepID=A0A218XBL4_PUNGR|nr:hypothetical protein CDL15_Pgr007940 [Punica granatum]